MATYKQEKALDKLVENGGNISKAMRDAGYSVETAKTPQKLTESKGFKELLVERGLTDELLIDALVADIQGKKGNRKAELELGFKIKGRITTEAEQGQKVQINIINYGGHDTVSIRPGTASVSVEDSTEQSEIQVVDYSSQGGEDSARPEQADTGEPAQSE